VRALVHRGVSLLPVGITAVRGTFARGDVVRCVDAGGAVIGQGLVNYSSEEAARLAGVPSAEIAQRLGYSLEAELVHRDNLVVLAQTQDIRAQHLTAQGLTAEDLPARDREAPDGATG
jgi:glutamate 5-kinase